MYEDSLLDAQYEDRFYVAEDHPFDTVDEDTSCEPDCDPANLRVYSDDEDQCIACGAISFV